MTERKKTYFVYLVRCRYGTLYAGYTTDLARRIAMHDRGCGAKYLRGRGPVTLVYSRELGTLEEALLAERELKKLSRKKKEELAGHRGQ